MEEKKEIIRITCENCWTDIEIPSDWKYQSIIPVCHKCNKVIRPELLEIGDRIVLTGSILEFTCQNCQHKFKVDEVYIKMGEAIFCPECDEEIEDDDTIEEDDDGIIKDNEDDEDEIEDLDDTEE